MYEVRIRADFSAAHNLREVGGKCESLHGHNFVVEAAVESETLDACGMVVDFRHFKQRLRAVLENL
ncbi:MAG TPA: 6-carboxytetrahydropterin synthase, partial [Thermodesulfobacteriota bacterium]|nr:6-carboxytetrahydropterin synthase [Thermodesulfobacteriota bacterium]